MKKTCRRVIMLALFACCVGIALEGTSIGVAAQKLERRLSTKALIDAPRLTGGIEILINELDADQDSTDTAEFVELKSTPNTSLAGLVLVFYNGNGAVSYQAYDLDAVTTDSNGFAIVGNSGVPGVDVVIGSSSLQNGPDAVALYIGDSTSFPNGTAVTTNNLIDAVVYDTGQADDPNLLVLLGSGTARRQIDENLGGTGTSRSIQRCSTELRDARAFVVRTPTPNAENNQVCPRANVDMNGDGRTDWVITRPNQPPALSGVLPAGRTSSRERRSRLKSQIQTSNVAGGDQTLWRWWSENNGTPGTLTVPFGSALDDLTVSGDFDGDGSDDIAVWAPDPGAFRSLNSSDFTFRETSLGMIGDDPAVIGDYDGDGADDPAVYRCPQAPPDGQCYFYYVGSLNNPSGNITSEDWGFGTFFDWVPYPGDFDGDGKDDFCVEYIGNPPQAAFWLRLNGKPGFEVINFGLTTDLVVPGDFDGDGRSDFTVLRIVDEDRYRFWTRERDGGITVMNWGIYPDDVVPGDYDGDGRTDYAIFRWWAPTPTFWIRPSNGDRHWVKTWGLQDDYPLARWQVQ